jgi:hypothetical protein
MNSGTPTIEGSADFECFDMNGLAVLFTRLIVCCSQNLTDPPCAWMFDLNCAYDSLPFVSILARQQKRSREKSLLQQWKHEILARILLDMTTMRNGGAPFALVSR